MTGISLLSKHEKEGKFKGDFSLKNIKSLWYKSKPIVFAFQNLFDFVLFKNYKKTFLFPQILYDYSLSDDEDLMEGKHGGYGYRFEFQNCR